MSRIRLALESLEDRCTPSGSGFTPPAFRGLDVAVVRLYPVDPSVPPNPARMAPVFALNYGDSVDPVGVPHGLDVALSHYPVDPSLTASPIFFGLADAEPPVDG